MAVRTQYARNGDVSIAYQVTGEGPRDLVIVPGFISHLELDWTFHELNDMLRALGSFARLIRFDKRGTGLSDPVAGVPTIDERMDDLRAVLDAAGSQRATLLGYSEGGPMSLLFAATHPARTESLILYGTFAKGAADADDPSSLDPASVERIRNVVHRWGEGEILTVFAPSLVEDDAARRAAATFERASASPGMARALIRAVVEIDVKPILGSITVPTLVLHRHEVAIPIEAGRYLGANIPGARFVELQGVDHMMQVGDWRRIVAEVEEFMTGARHSHETDRVLATVLFTDIVGSTERVAELGDVRWRALLSRHDELVRAAVGTFRGRFVKSLGDGALATFDGPARAIHCAEAIRDSARELGVEIRAGVHTGECEAMGEDIGGLAVHIGARVGSLAGPGEVLVSGTVKDLVVGSDMEFADRGEHELKGVPGAWRLFSVGEARAPREHLPPAADHMTRTDRTILRLARRAPGALRLANRLTIRAQPEPGGPAKTPAG